MSTTPDRSPTVSRRRAIGLGGAAVAGGALATVAGPLTPAAASRPEQMVGVPKPIPGGFDAGPPVGFIHFFLPGPLDAVTPVLGFPGEGLDVEPSTMTDFRGTTAFAILTGDVTASDGREYLGEVDVRVMEGEYLDENGDSFEAAFAFL